MTDKMTDEERLLCNPDSEQIVLGGLLYFPEYFSDLMELLQADDFYRKENSRIFRIIAKLHKTNGAPPDHMLLLEYLEAEGHLQQVGGELYILDLGHVVAGMGYVNLMGHAKVVRAYRERRALRDVAAQVAGMAFDSEQSTEESMAKAEQLIRALTSSRSTGGFQSSHQLVKLFLDDLERRSRLGPDELLGIPTGFTDLDRMTGGFQQQQLYILGGRPGQGKSSLLLNFVLNAWEKTKAHVGVVTLEMSSLDFIRRLVSMKAGIDGHFLRLPYHLQDSDYSKILEATGELDANDRWFVDGSERMTIGELRARCRQRKNKQGLDILFVDYLQKLHADGKFANRNEEIGYISSELHSLAKELDIPVVVIASLNRNSEQRADKRPQMSDVRESGTIESDAAVVLLLYKSPDEAMKNITTLIVDKNRHGASGDVLLQFDAKYTRFHDLEQTFSEEDFE